MDRIKITGIPPYDGEYPLDLDRFNHRELHTFKRLAGIRANELEDAFKAGDSDIIVCLAIIALHRANVADVDEDLIWDAEVGKIDFIGEDEASPPAETPPASSGSGDEKKRSSGESLSNGGGHLLSVPSPTGSPASQIGLASAPETSPR